MAGERGVMALAVGAWDYHRMARWMLTSLRRCHPDWPIALATDSRDPRLLRLADHVIPVSVPEEGPYALKLRMNELSPFAETLLLDVDCLVVRPVPEIWGVFSGVPVGVLGYNVTEGPWFGDIRVLRSHVGSPTLPIFNGGLYYFDQSDTARAVFDDARRLMADYDHLGILPFRGSLAEEPIMAMALAKHGIAAQWDDDLEVFRVAMFLTKPVQADVLRGRCRVTTADDEWNPAIVHFADGAQDPVYIREGRALELVGKGFPAVTARAISRAKGAAERVSGALPVRKR